LLLGLLRERDSFAADLLNASGLSLEDARQRISLWQAETRSNIQNAPSMGIVEVHGKRLPMALINNTVDKLKRFAWIRRHWQPMDVVVDNQEGGICFDLSVKNDPRYAFVSGGWTKEPCAICGWELSAEGGPERSEGFTNGRRWLCTECYHRFVAKKRAA
jgi:DNA-directed RNA polymerase subunit RPC12/RpoP